ncbi:GFA family protein [Litorimonas sp. WD9-15]|uniref:GFA family protein n=1 Tax=Litorimonas sp. WD9-15 TaxID=3418716 RepID=UPI003D08CC79
MTERTGQCLCGGVSFTTHGEVKEADACHCSMCRRQGGGGPYFAVQFKGGVTLDKTDTLAWYRGSDHGERGFCTACGASIAWRLQSQPESMGVSLGALDDTSGITLDSHIFTDSAPDYYTVPTDAPHKTEAQVIQEFMERMEKAAQKEADNS